jgi:hypothetical protein
LVSAFGSSDLATVSLNFSEPMSPTSSQLAGHYNVRLRGGGASLGVSSAVLTNGTNVILTTTAPRNATADYEVVVTDVGDAAFTPNLITPNPTTANIVATIALVPIDATQQWRYDESNVFPGASWITPGYVDSAWLQGAALLAFENATLAFPIRTILSLTNQAGATNTTFYFRTHFNFSGDPTTADVVITPVVDDGAVFYLNGTEIYRIGVTNMPVTHGDLASRNVGDAQPEGPFHLGVLSELHSGDNVLAVEVHQVALTSSDVTMGVELHALVETQVGGPKLSITRSGANVVISWPNAPGYVLVSATNVKGPYTPVAGNPSSPVTITPTTGGKVYYQLRNP